ncbi:MAG: Hsp70 family protein, partial [Butyrivibrio sp.]|nr:Hsp70 family protein [Butyrivibrio sp.]
AIKEAQEYEAQDKKRKEGIDARNEADSFVFQTEKALSDVGDKIDAAEMAKVEENLKDMKELREQTKDRELTDDEIDKIKAGQEKLMTGAQALFAKMYEAQGAGAQGAPDPSQFAQGMGGDMGGGADASAGNGPAADDVVDGDYREV